MNVCSKNINIIHPCDGNIILVEECSLIGNMHGKVCVDLNVKAKAWADSLKFVCEIQAKIDSNVCVRMQILSNEVKTKTHKTKWDKGPEQMLHWVV